ncbi:MAG: phage/plasmid primase, P4 family [Methanogenium sp.]
MKDLQNIEEFNKNYSNEIESLNNAIKTKYIEDKYWYEKKMNSKGELIYKLIFNKLVDKLQKDMKFMFLADKFHIYKNGYYKMYSVKEIQKMLKSYLMANYTSRDIKEVLELLSMDVYIKPEKVNNRDNIINFKNCILEINKDKIKTMKHNSSYNWTIQYQHNYNNKIICSKWQSFLDEVITKDNQLILQEMFGYSLLLSQKCKAFFILTGVTDCGKSVVLNTLSKIIGNNYISRLSLQTLTDEKERFRVSEIYQKVANICGDISDAFLQSTGMLKQITGNEPIDTEIKHVQEGLRFFPYATLIFSCNTLPKCKDKTDAFYNRTCIIPFINQSIPKEKQDKDLINKFNIEGVINWSIQGLIRLVNNNYNPSTSIESLQAKERYRIENNNVLEFINECCEFDDKFEITTTLLFLHYQNFCKENEFTCKSMRSFVNDIQTVKNVKYSNKIKDYIDMDTKYKRGFKGLKLKEN